MSEWPHETVLKQEVADALAPVDGEVFVDATVGMGGHSEALLQRAKCRVIGIDRDVEALQICRDRLAGFGDSFVGVHGAFDDLENLLDNLGVGGVDGIVADLGVSSLQLDSPSRGFSFRFAGPIDMRMNSSASTSALDIVNGWTEASLKQCIKEYGEERFAGRIARAIVQHRPFQDTKQLADTIAAAVPRKFQTRIHPSTRTFQALRIQVNDELGQLERLLPAAVRRLNAGGRLAIISFHSLEDRLVKTFLSHETGRNAPRDAYGHPVTPPRLQAPRRAQKPSPEDPNPRARSARLRTAVRLP